MDRYAISAIPTSKSEIKQCQASSQGILPTHPFRAYIVGASGSGKSNLLISLLSRTDMYKDYFDKIFILSPTANKLDDSYKILNLDDDSYFDPQNGTELLKVIESIQKKNINKIGIGKAPKVLIVMDDIISYKKFMRSKILLKFFIMSRHYGISIILLSQAYHRVPKSIRLNVSALMFFRGSQKENEVVYMDYCCPGFNKKSFLKLINEATKERYNFLYIDLNRSITSGRYRKNLTEKLI